MTNPFKFWKKKKVNVFDPIVPQVKDGTKETIVWAGIIGTAVMTAFKFLTGGKTK